MAVVWMACAYHCTALVQELDERIRSRKVQRLIATAQQKLDDARSGKGGREGASTAGSPSPRGSAGSARSRASSGPHGGTGGLGDTASSASSAGSVASGGRKGRHKKGKDFLARNARLTDQARFYSLTGAEEERLKVHAHRCLLQQAIAVCSPAVTLFLSNVCALVNVVHHLCFPCRSYCWESLREPWRVQLAVVARQRNPWKLCWER